MSFEIKLEVDSREFDAFLKKASMKHITAAAVRALDRTFVTVQKEAAQKIRTSIKLPIRDIKSALKIRKQYGANMPLGNLTGSLLSSTESISLSRFKPRQVASGVRVNINGKAQIIRSAFIARMPNASSPSVFRRLRVEKPGTSIRRVGANRSELPIRKQATQGINRLIPSLAPDLAKKAIEVFYPRFNHELLRRIK